MNTDPRKLQRIGVGFVIVVLMTRGVLGSLAAIWIQSALGVAWSVVAIGFGILGIFGWRRRHDRAVAITMGGATYMAGSVALSALRAGTPPYLWGAVTLVSLLLLLAYRK